MYALYFKQGRITGNSLPYDTGFISKNTIFAIKINISGKLKETVIVMR